MNKDEVIKELEELRDIKDYSKSELLNTGYRTAILDAIDLVKKLTIPVVMQSLPKRLSNRAYGNAKTMRYEDFVKWWDEQV
tara:strand:+ start:7473 stop:7715 length:243 start_codon:yes stop_codon:yes gene_type:complete